MNSTFSISSLSRPVIGRGCFRSIWHRVVLLHLFPSFFNLNKWFSHILRFLFCAFSWFSRILSFFFCVFLWFFRLIVVLCCSSSCVTFDFTSCCGVRLITIERSASVRFRFNQWFGHQRCRSKNMGIPMT